MAKGEARQEQKEHAPSEEKREAEYGGDSSSRTVER
jgi:hypothetical protein